MVQNQLSLMMGGNGKEMHEDWSSFAKIGQALWQRQSIGTNWDAAAYLNARAWRRCLRGVWFHPAV